MMNRHTSLRSAVVLALGLGIFSYTSAVRAASGTWTADADGNWTDSGNWSGGTIADGSGNTASFTAELTADRTVTLNGDRTIGNITFTDGATSSNNLTISGANILTLAGGTPTIDVTQSARTLTIGSEIAGSAGLTKTGAGTLSLSGSNTFTGNATVSAGTLVLSGNNTISTSGGNATFSGTSSIIQLQANNANTASFTTPSTALNSDSASTTVAGKLVWAGTTPILRLRSDETVTFANGWGGLNNRTVTIDVDALTAGSDKVLTFAPNGSPWGTSSGAVQINITGNTTGTGYSLALGQLNAIANSNTVNPFTFNPTSASVSIAGISSTSTGTYTQSIVLDGTATGNSVGAITKGTNANFSVTKNNSSTWTMTGNGTYTGNTTVSGGTLVLAGGNGSTAATTGNTTNNSISIGASGTLQLQANGTNTVSGVSTALANTSITTGPLTISASGATLQLRSDSDVTFAAGGSGTTSVIGGVNGRNLNIDVNQLTAGNTNKVLQFATTGKVLAWANAVTINVTGGNGYSLSLPTLARAATGSASTITLNPTSANLTIAGFTSSAAVTSTLALGGTTTGNQVTGAIANSTGTGTPATSVTKSNSSTWTLSGASTYTGATAVNVGTLLVNGNHTGGAAYTVAAGAILGGTGSTASTLSVSGTLSPGASIESFASGALTMDGTSSFIFETLNNSATGADLMVVSGALSLTGVALNLAGPTALSDGSWAVGDKLTLISYTDAGSGITSGFTGYANDTIYTFGTNNWLFKYNDATKGNNYAGDAPAPGPNNYFVTMTLVPEPSSLAMLAFGMMTLWLFRKRS